MVPRVCYFARILEKSCRSQVFVYFMENFGKFWGCLLKKLKFHKGSVMGGSGWSLVANNADRCADCQTHGLDVAKE